ncbi:epimerase-domain-containing protein [Neoconidiobolus thromboides FSU 785]|nr:epimerase-domain-containing protein [Neoconidiobolus thromboides FSU 785]
MATSKRILVTGGKGLVGHGIKLSLEQEKSQNKSIEGEEWFFISSKDGDLRDPVATEALFQKYAPTHVVHLAAKVGGLFANMSQPETFLQDNLLINNNILNMCLKYKITKLISCLSTCIFPDKVSYPIDETMIHLGPPHDSNFGYAYAKRLLDIQNKAYHQQHGCHFTSIIPTNIFGPYDNFSLKESHVIPGLIHKAYLSKKDNTPFIIQGTGKPLRQFIYSLDLGRLIVWCLREYMEIEPIILSVGEEQEISIGYVAESIAKSMGIKDVLKYDTTKSDGQYKKTASNQKLLKYLPEFEFTPFEVAIEKTISWFLENVDNIRK